MNYSNFGRNLYSAIYHECFQDICFNPKSLRFNINRHLFTNNKIGQSGGPFYEGLIIVDTLTKLL